MFTMCRTLLGRPLRRSCAFLVDGLLIETGSPAGAPELLAALRGSPVDKAAVSHLHEDHAGGIAALAAAGVPVLAPPEALDYLAAPPRLPFYRRLAFGPQQPAQANGLGEALETGLYRFRVLPTPGHTPDHRVFFEPAQGWLFSGDLFVSERLHYLYRKEDLGVLLSSLDQVLCLDFDAIFCTHRGYVPQGKKRLAAKRHNLLLLLSEALRLQRKGLSPSQITSRLLGPPGFASIISLGEFSKGNLTRALLALAADNPEIVRRL